MCHPIYVQQFRQLIKYWVHVGRSLRALERAGCSDEEHRSQHEKALQAGLQTAEDYTEVTCPSS